MPLRLETPTDKDFDNLFLPSHLQRLDCETKSITVYDGPAVFISPTSKIAGAATVNFTLFPKVRLTFNFIAADPDSVIGLATSYDSANGTLLDLVDIKRTLDVSVNGMTTASNSLERSAYGVVIDDGRDVARLPDVPVPSLRTVRFHLLNFRDFHGERLHGPVSMEGRIWFGRTHANFGPWSLTIDALPDLRERHEHLHQNHGCVITHLCDLRMQDGSLFTTAEGSNVVEFVYWILSFVNGARCACTLVEGYDDTGLTSWTQWPSYITDVGAPVANWFPELRPIQALQVTERAWTIWEDSNKRKWLRLIIAIYTDCNRNNSGTEVEVARAHTALEVLAWAVLQDEKQQISETALRNLDAAPRLRRLLNACKIPSAIPANLTDLRSAFVNVSNADGPSAVVAVRNIMAHPTKRNLAKLQRYGLMAQFQAWYLSLWYIEMILLSLFGYNDKYTNRLRIGGMAGAIENVPWMDSLTHWKA